MGSIIKFVIGFSLLVVVGISLLFYSVNSAFHKPLLLSNSQVLLVDSGRYAHSIIDDLSTRSILRDPVLVKIALKLEPQLSLVKVGTYELKFGMSVRDLFVDLSTGNEKTFLVRLVDGLTWNEWLNQLNNTPHLVPAILSPAEWLSVIDPTYEAISMEGTLMPDTYQYTANTKVIDIVRRANQSMSQYLRQAWQSRALDLPYASPYEALVMASIIEKETGVASERPRIAGVFVNRLRINMRLQTDPTVIYGMGESFDGNIRRKDLRQFTPYNTYVIKGLPPTPIAMVGKLAIDAALNPQVTDELYFVSKGDGSHQFSVTLEQHNQAVRTYQLK